MDGPAVVYPPGFFNTDKWYYEGKFVFNGKKPQVDPKGYYKRKMRAYLNKVALLQMEEVQSE